MIDENTLPTVLKFSPDDLALNRAGKLSDAQKRRLRRDAAGALAFAVFAAGAAIAIALLPAATFVRPLLMKSIYGGMMLLLAAASGGIYWREVKVAEASIAIRVTGIPTIKKRRGIFRMTIDETELWVPRAMDTSILPDHRYHAYHAQGSPILLSAELISAS